MKKFRVQLLSAVAIAGLLAAGSSAHAGAVLLTAGVDADGTGISVPAASNPHIPGISPGVTFSPVLPGFLGGVDTGPLNGITYPAIAYAGSIGGTTGWINLSYVVTTSDFGLPLFMEVANVGDTSFPSALAFDNFTINGILVAGFEDGLLPVGWTSNGFFGTSGLVANLAPTEGLLFGFLDTTGAALAVFDTIDGTNAGNIFAPLGVLVGDVLSFDFAFLTTDGTSFYHDYAIAAFGVPQVVGPVPEPTSLALLAIGALGLAGRRLRRKSVA